jgi:Zn-finger nucleic acid-binding protein
MPTIACPRCRLPIDASERTEEGRVYCSKCRDWFATGPSTAITSGSRDLPPRPGPSRYDDIDESESVEEAERRRRIRRRARFVDEHDAVMPPLGRGLALTACILLVVVGFAEAAMIGVYIWHAIRDAGPFTLLETQSIVAAFEWLLFFVAGIVFIGWLRTAHRNLGYLRGPKLVWSSGWAAGSFFVPIACLISPYLVVQEMWVASGPLVRTPTEDDGFEPRPSSGNVLLMSWWGLWALGNCLAWLIGNVFLWLEPNLPRLIGVLIVPHVLFLIDVPLAILVIRGMVARQESRWQELVAAEAGDLS